MRIGVNALYLIPGGVGGTEIYLRSLLGALAEVDRENEYAVFTNRETGADIVPAAPNFEAAPQRVRAAVRPWRILWEQTALPAAVARRRIEVLFNPGFTSPAICPCPAVTVFHDLQHKRHPEFFRWFDLPFWRLLLWQAAHTSARLLAVSEATRDDLLRFYRIPAGKIRVAPHGVDEKFFAIGRTRRSGAPRPFLLTVSTLHPHKNLERLLRAFAAFRRSRSGFQLVIAGMHGFQTEAIQSSIASLGLEEAVRLTGWVTSEKLLELYASAHACVFPTLFEGFGMPVLEALAAGIPTACSDIEPLRSVAGEAALRFEPGDEDAIAAAIFRIAEDEPLRGKLAEAGPIQAGRFTWRRTALDTLALLREAAGQT